MKRRKKRPLVEGLPESSRFLLWGLVESMAADMVEGQAPRIRKHLQGSFQADFKDWIAFAVERSVVNGVAALPRKRRLTPAALYTEILSLIFEMHQTAQKNGVEFHVRLRCLHRHLAATFGAKDYRMIPKGLTRKYAALALEQFNELEIAHDDKRHVVDKNVFSSLKNHQEDFREDIPTSKILIDKAN